MSDAVVRFYAEQITYLLESADVDKRAAILADLHDMAADLSPNVRALLARVFEEVS